MQTPPVSIRTFLRLIPFIGITALLQAAEPSLTISQTVFLPEKEELRFTARSNLLDGYILVENTEIASFGFIGKPLPGLRLYGGSLLASGFPARAGAPVFALYTPFYRPVSAYPGPVFRNSETADTQNAAAELSFRNIGIAALANLEPESTDPSWILLSRSLPAFDVTDLALTLSVLGATRVRAATADAADSWFLAEMPLPETRIFLSGMEILARKGKISGSCAGFLDLGQLIAPSGAIRADAAFSMTGFSLAGGFYRSDSGFEDLDGTRNSTLARVFAAPSISVPVGKTSGGELKWGGILYGDSIRRENFHEDDTVAVSGGTGIELHTRATRSEIKVMKNGMETELAGGLYLAEFLHPSLKLELRAKTVQTRLTEELKKETTVSGKLSATPIRWFSASISGTAGWTTAHTDMDYSVSLSLGFSAKIARQDWNLGVKITRQNTGEELAGSIALKLVLR